MHDDLPLVVGGAVAQGLLTLDEVEEAARELVTRVTGILEEIRASVLVS